MKLFFAIPLMLAGLGASAADEPPPVGTDTRAWMQLQETDDASKAPVRGLTGEAADRVYLRYLQSFTRPIPERFERDRIAGEGQK